MKPQRVLTVVTLFNVLVLLFSLSQTRAVMAEGTALRLMNSKGRPNVKIAATERGSGQLLGGESDPTYVQILAEGPSTSLKLSDKNDREQLIKP